MEGYETGDLGPMEPITREQAMVMIARAMKIAGLNGLQTSEVSKALAPFTDVGEIAEWARIASPDAFKPDLFRAEAMESFHRRLQ